MNPTETKMIVQAPAGRAKASVVAVVPEGLPEAVERTTRAAGAIVFAEPRVDLASLAEAA